jgi:hypothetical protein
MLRAACEHEGYEHEGLIMEATVRDACITCYGVGETVTDRGPSACPDCFGEGKALSDGTKIEWRLRAIERASPTSDHDVAADVRWLVHEVRRHREVLVRILARCQDEAESNALAVEIKYWANDALAIYSPK